MAGSVACRSRLGLALVGVLAAALALGGCGRKGPLDPPPGARLTEPAPAGPPAAPYEVGPDGQPLAPVGPKKRIFLDWLID